MLIELLPSRTELLNRYCSVYGTERADAEYVIDRALVAAEADAELRGALFSWLIDRELRDVDTDGYSLCQTAATVSKIAPDVPTACYLAYLHRQCGMLGIMETAGSLCEVSEDVFAMRDAPFSIRKTEQNAWRVIGVIENSDLERSERMLTVELWRVVERYPMLLRPCLSGARIGDVWICEDGRMYRG